MAGFIVYMLLLMAPTPVTVSSSIALEALREIIRIDGVLIAFTASASTLIFAYVLGRGKVIHPEKLRRAYLLTVFAVILFIVSIIGSFNGMIHLEPQSTTKQETITLPLAFMVWALVMFIGNMVEVYESLKE